MITDLDLPPSPTPAGKPAHRRRVAARRYARLGIDSALNLGRLAREELFERTHSSFWEPNLLDRLSQPLSRIHE